MIFTEIFIFWMLAGVITYILSTYMFVGKYIHEMIVQNSRRKFSGSAAVKRMVRDKALQMFSVITAWPLSIIGIIAMGYAIKGNDYFPVKREVGDSPKIFASKVLDWYDSVC